MDAEDFVKSTGPTQVHTGQTLHYGATATHYGRSGPTQMWLPPGPYLTQSTWRKNSKVLVIVGSTVVGAAMAIVAVVAIAFGALTSSQFTARGGVAVSCSSGAAFLGAIHPGVQVTFWTEGGANMGSAKLDAMKVGTDAATGKRTCYLPFERAGLSTGQAGYVVTINGALSQFVTTSALRSGAMLRPIG